MAADELGGGMYHHVGTMFQRTQQEGSSEGVVHNQGHAMAMGHFSHGLQVRHVGIGVAEGFYVNGLGVGSEGGLQGFKVVDVDNGVGYVLRRKGVRDEVERATVQVVGGNDVVAVEQDVLQGVGYGSRTAGHGQSGHAAFESCHAILQHSLRGVGQTAVDVTGIAQSEAVGGVLRIAENV